MNYLRLIPPNSFMGRYLRYMQSQETASVFDFYTGLWCISTACGRFAYVHRPRAPVYLNMYIVLVGESGVARKSTAVHTASAVVRSIVGGNSPIGILDAKVTPEKLDEILHARTAELGHAQMAIIASEMAVFVGTERYIAHMPTLLTDLYDCPNERIGGGTIARGSVVQRYVWINFLTASTPVWLLKTVNPNVVEGGFTSRCYFIVANAPKKRIPWPEDVDSTLFTDLKDDIKIIHAEAMEHGAIAVNSQAVTAFSTWYNNRLHSVDPYTQSFESREDAHVLRIAALLCINDGSWIIKRSHVLVAIRLITEMKKQSTQIFESAEAMTKYASALDIVRAQLMSAGMDPMPRHHLYRRCKYHVNNEEFNSLIEVMHEVGAIQRFHIKGEVGRPTEFIRGTSMLTSQGLGDAVMERFTS